MNKPYPYYEHKKLNSIKELITINYKKCPNDIAFMYRKGKDITCKTYKDYYLDVLHLSKYLSNKYNNKNISIISNNSYNYLVLFSSIIISGNVAVLIDKDLDENSVLRLIKKYNLLDIYYDDNYCDIDNIISKYKCSKINDLEQLINEGKELKFKNNKKTRKESVIFFTSGTTGNSKGVMLSEENILSDIYSACSLFKPNGLAFSCLPFNHAFGLITSIFMPFNYKVPVFINTSLKNLTTDLKLSKPNTMFVVPLFIETFYKQIWKEARRKKVNYLLKGAFKLNQNLKHIHIDLRKVFFKGILNSFGGNLEYIICGGANLDKKYIKWFRNIGINILNGYGITECSPVVAVNRNYHYKDTSVGRIGRDIEVKIVDDEILVKGNIVMLGYYKEEAETKKVMDKGYFKTGDFGFIDRQGFLHITGRKKNLIILSNGENISPEEIENKLSKDKGVEEVIVYARDGKLIAEIYPTEEYLKNRAYFTGLMYRYNIKNAKNRQLSKIKLRMEEFPKNSNKKIVRSKIKED